MYRARRHFGHATALVHSDNDHRVNSPRMADAVGLRGADQPQAGGVDDQSVGVWFARLNQKIPQLVLSSITSDDALRGDSDGDVDER